MLHGHGTLTCPGAVFTGKFENGNKAEGVLVWGDKK
jgi:hypothetical protein